MLDDVKDLVDQEVQGVNMMELSAFAVIGRASSLRSGARCPLHVSSSCQAEDSRGHHARW